MKISEHNLRLLTDNLGDMAPVNTRYLDKKPIKTKETAIVRKPTKSLLRTLTTSIYKDCSMNLKNSIFTV
ncbi:MAG: hypothetical protein ACFCUU_04230 [Cyclobacteriaceae bacterium]